MNPRSPMPLRSFRCPDKDWEAALAKADERGENFSEKLREFTKKYGQQKGGK